MGRRPAREAVPPVMPLLRSMPLPPNYHEWDAVLGDMGLSEGALRITAETMVVWARDTKRSMTEAVEALRERAPQWHYLELAEGGHMFPLTQSDLINPLISGFLNGRADVSRQEVRP